MKILALVGLTVAFGLSNTASAAVNKTVEQWCVFDPVGAQGDIMRRMRDLALHSQKLQASVQLKSFRNEQQAIDAFEQKKCSGLVLTNFHVRPYNRFIASSSGIGMMPSNQSARRLLQLFDHPTLRKRLSQNGYAVLGLIPVGNAFMTVNRVSINGVSDLKNKRIGVLIDEPAQVAVAKSIGGIPVAMDVSDPISSLKQRKLDMMPSPIYALLPYDLNRELGGNTRVINFPIAYVAMTLVVREQVYPKNYATAMRQWFVQNANSLAMQATRWENSLPAYYWEDTSRGEQRAYAMVVEKTQRIYIENGYYDRFFAELSKRLRCLEDASSAICTR